MHMIKNVNIPPAILLGLVAFGYFSLQWLASSKIAGNIIFSQSAAVDRENFSKMVKSISELARLKCGSEGVDKILFDDGDVVTPYLLGADNKLGNCEVSRETVVTPFTASEKQACNVLRIHQYSPPAVENPDEYESTQFEIERWYSKDHRFGYQVLLSRCVNSNHMDSK